MKNIFRIIIISLFYTAMSSAHADEVRVSKAVDTSIRKAIDVSMPGAKIDSIRSSEIKGLYEVFVNEIVLYTSVDGRYVIEGHLLDTVTRKDLTNLRMNPDRKQALEKLGVNKMIVFEAKIKKHTVTVFTDIDCGYCRKLHTEINQYLAEGITVQYVFYPRAGKDSESYKQALSVWCADNRQAALTEAFKGNVPTARTCDNPIAEHMELVKKFKVRGTPAIVAQNGHLFVGYLTPKQLSEALDREN